MGYIKIQNGTVWDGEQFSQKDIYVEGTTITKMGNGLTEPVDYCFDAKGKMVLPGLVDVHTHMLGIYGIPVDLSCVPFGVTAAADAAAEIKMHEAYNHFLVKNVAFIGAGALCNRAQLEDTKRGLKIFGEKAIGIKFCFDTEVSDVKDITPLKEICDFAKEKNLKMMVHCSNSPEPLAKIVEVMGKGDILTHAFHGGIHNASEDGFDCLKAAEEKGIVVDTGFAGFVHTDFQVFRDAVKVGVLPDTISTDITKCSAYKRGGKYGMAMCMSMAKQMGMCEEDIFRAVTSVPAKVLGKEQEWGTLQAGRCADIAVFDEEGEAFSLTDKRGNTVCDTKSYRCALCIANGEVVYRA